MNPEREVASRIWPEHAEMCSEEDWLVLSRTIEEERPVTESIIEPIGESKDAILASLLILYYTMKIAHLALIIAKEVSGLEGVQKVKAIIDAVTARIDDSTPRLVRDRIEDIVDELKLP